MSRICRFYHAIPRDEEQCAEGHYLCATLDCQVKGCKYITRPHSMSNLKHAIEMMKLHMAVTSLVQSALNFSSTRKMSSAEQLSMLNTDEALEITPKSCR